MPPRKSTDFGALFESLIEDLRIQVAASVDRTLSDFNKRIARIERRLDQLDPASAQEEQAPQRRSCSLCDRPSVARGLCSAHYQQWRYRERKQKLARRFEEANLPSTVFLPNDVATDN
jgi:DNA repair exonuclease SbcCD ATPase subunit